MSKLGEVARVTGDEKDVAALVGMLKAVRTWAQAQERTVTEAKDKARDAVIREIKAAADKL